MPVERGISKRNPPKTNLSIPNATQKSLSKARAGAARAKAAAEDKARAEVAAKARAEEAARANAAPLYGPNLTRRSAKQNWQSLKTHLALINITGKTIETNLKKLFEPKVSNMIENKDPEEEDDDDAKETLDILEHRIIESEEPIDACNMMCRGRSALSQ